MNRSESKYFTTAAKMDQALLTLLEKKDLAYITVKEICEAAGVNRSTFYLHYETVGDLLAECAQYINDQFRSHMEKDEAAFVSKLRTCPMEELYLITPEYLTPYLDYIRKNQRLFRTVLEQAATLRLEDSYAGLTRYVLLPILERFGVPEQDRDYILAFHISGLMAIITQWLKSGCADSTEHVIAVILRCVKTYGERP